MEPKAYFIKSLQHIDNIIVQIKDSDWHNVTPCTEWNLHDLVNHMVVEVAWIPDPVSYTHLDVYKRQIALCFL